ncbi:MAG: oxidoreductase [Rhodocyclaceae bacterium]|nr:oxidoreductase [Rhodocyclaceae bacterium]
MNVDSKHFYAGLRELAESAFPKQCRNCGRTYQTAAEFVAATQPLAPDKSGLKQSIDDDGRAIVELFRNCVCGSTLMDSFNDRRDLSEGGLRRRQRFGELVEYLQGQGLPRLTARDELLKVVRGQPSELLRDLKVTQPPPTAKGAG